MDLKLPNLVFNADTNSILIIDFGTSFQTVGERDERVKLKAASMECMPLFMREIEKGEMTIKFSKNLNNS